eukprot:scaffold7269_cov93-Skeletonema_marinoi.AAC.3
MRALTPGSGLAAVAATRRVDTIRIKKMFGQKWPRYEKEIEKLLTLASNASALTLFIFASSNANA